MKIKNILAVSAVALLGLSSCSKWTDMEIQHPMDLTKPAHTEEYYKALRDYKTLITSSPSLTTALGQGSVRTCRAL